MNSAKNEALEKRNPSEAQRAKRDKILLIIISLLSFLGFVDSTYLTIVHYKNIIPSCTFVKGCETVLTSSFSEFLGIPVALIGSIYFAVLIIFCIILLQKNLKNGRKTLLILTFLGALAAIFFFSVQAFILRAFCQYCLLIEAIIFGIFILSFKLKESF